MRTLYLDCGMGAAGDMLAAALIELLDDKTTFLETMNALGLPGVHVSIAPSTKCGIVGTHFSVTIDGQEEDDGDHDHHHEHDHDHDHHDHEHAHHHAHGHHHSSMTEIQRIVDGLPVSESVRKKVMEVYQQIAEAESLAHGVPVTDIHFHEVGTLDAVADVTAVCLLMELLGVEKVIASAIHVGCGHVHCAHGILPVPAPATATILKGVPIYGGGVKGELCTPTGAALLKTFVSSFGEMPPMNVQRIGYGMGRKDFEQANCVRAMLGETADQTTQVVELVCTLDDMTAESLGFAMETLFAAGALDVYTVPVGMKKSRPGILLCVMCLEERRHDLLKLLFKHTTTLGVREYRSNRHTLKRHMETMATPYGDVRVKVSEGYGVTRRKCEYEDLARLARETGLSLEEILHKGVH